MSTENTLQTPTDLNIDAAKKYVSSVETSIVAEPAKAALVKLKAGLESTSNTKQDLIALAQGVASAQVAPDSKFTVQEFANQIMAPSVPQSTHGTLEKNETLPRNATAEYIVEKVYETGNETLIDGAEILL